MLSNINLKELKKKQFSNPLVHYSGLKEIDEDELLSIPLVSFFIRYPIESITTKYRGHDNLICVKAYDREFIVKPYEGKQDWELMLKKLERAKYGVFTEIERSRESINE